MSSQTIYLRDEFAPIWRDKNVYTELDKLDGDVFRNKEGRKTMRFDFAGKSYFLKLHRGIGWGEVFKNLLALRLPVISAKNEWQAIQFLHQHKIETMTLAAYGEKGWNPAHRHSFVITDDLTETMSLEHLGQQWKKRAPDYTTKKQLIEKLAHIAGTMHREGMNHRDFYLCHFLLDDSFAQTNLFNTDTPLYLIDLHRAQIRKRTPKRWVIKDLGSLYFSAYDVPLSKRDLFRFMRFYTQLPLRQILKEQADFWQKVTQRADKLYRE